MVPIYETNRLIRRPFNTADAAFVLQLLNTPEWLQFIGDRGVLNLEEAVRYIEKGPLSSYKKNGYGLELVIEKSSGSPIGMCGIINRDSAMDPDIGFAFLKEFTGKGYATEMVSFTLAQARKELKLPRVLAIIKPGNLKSIKVAHNTGMVFDRMMKFPEEAEELMIFNTCWKDEKD